MRATPPGLDLGAFRQSWNIVPDVAGAQLEHRVGEEAFLPSDGPGGTYSAVFEDDGDTGYFYGLDTTREQAGDNPILDALQVYSVAAVEDREASYPIEIRWAAEGNRAGLFIEGRCHAIFDFDLRRAVCRTGFPESSGEFTPSHDWDETLVAGL